MTDATIAKTIGWHRHRWTRWGEPFNPVSRFVEDNPRLTSLKGFAPIFFQERRCTVCNRIQQELVTKL